MSIFYSFPRMACYKNTRCTKSYPYSEKEFSTTVGLFYWTPDFYHVWASLTIVSKRKRPGCLFNTFLESTPDTEVHVVTVHWDQMIASQFNFPAWAQISTCTYPLYYTCLGEVINDGNNELKLNYTHTTWTQMVNYFSIPGCHAWPVLAWANGSRPQTSLTEAMW